MNVPLQKKVAPHPLGGTEQLEQVKQRLAVCGHAEDRLRELIKLSRLLPPLSMALKQQTPQITGCENTVWLGCQALSHDVLHFYGDSEGRIVKGLLAVLLTACEGRSPQQILDMDLMALFNNSGIDRQLSPTRHTGLRAISDAIYQYARQAMTA